MPAIVELVAEHGVLAVMAGMVIEEVFVPVPSPVIPMAAGYLLIDAASLPLAMFQAFFLIAVPASVASVVSSYFVYGIAFYGGKPVIENYGRYLDVSWEEVQHLERHFDHEHEKYYVALFRAVPIVPLSLISGSAGLFRMDWREYGVWSFIGMLPRNFFLAMVGWYVGDGFVALASRIDTLSTAVAVLVAGSVAAVIGYRELKDLQRYLFRKA
ncbi:MAG: DedA family protein [Candidatus Nanohaloarchaea archaeon]